MTAILNRAANIAAVLIIGLTAFAFMTSTPRPPVALPPETSTDGIGNGAGGSMYAPPRIALLTDEQCLDYDRARYWLVVAYIDPAPPMIGREWLGIGSGQNTRNHALGRGYYLVPLARDQSQDAFFIWRWPPITDSRASALYAAKIADLVSVTANSFDLDCERNARRRAVR